MTEIIEQTTKEMVNSFSGLLTGLTTGNIETAQVSELDTLYKNNRWYLVSNYRQVLSQLYVEHGLVETLVQQPVLDAFSNGFNIKTDLITPEEIEELEHELEDTGVIEQLIEGFAWGRLYGGGAIVILTNQKADEPLDILNIKDDDPLEFRAVDMWELYSTELKNDPEPEVNKPLGDATGDFYSYYGINIHKSRVLPIKGNTAPSFIRPRLRGWGLSVVEKLIRSINSYFKNQNVIFELLDEAKTDVMRMDGLNDAMSTVKGTEAVQNRMITASRLKNYTSTLTMDKNDEYDQKQISFSGLAEVLTQIRQGVAADLKMPLTKLFGVSSSGFNSGEDDIENYNSMVKSTVQTPSKRILSKIITIKALQMFGVELTDLKIEFEPMRILKATEEEEVKDRVQNRVIQAYQIGLMTSEEAKQAINKDSLLPVELDTSIEASQPLDGDYTEAVKGA